MDMTASIAPKSDQINADDLITGPVTVTVESVTVGTFEQPFNINVLEFPGRAYRPSKSMRRVMVNAWGKEASEYAGRQLTLYRNPEITFGRDKVGGIEISAMSHIDSPKSIPLTVTRGKRKDFTVQPLVIRDWAADLRAVKTVEAVTALGKAARGAGVPAAMIAAITARYNELKSATDA